MPRHAKHVANVGVALSAAALVFGLGAGPASAATVSCGDVVRVDTTLDADLHCSGDGLLVLANATLNLGGHTISGGGGSGTGVAFEDFSTGEQADSARVRNGRITGFGTGIFASVYSTLGLERVKIDHSGIGLDVPESQTVTVIRSELVDNSDAIVADLFSANISVSSSALSRNAHFALLTPLAFVSVDDSKVDSNGGIAVCSQGSLGIHRSRITGNAGGIDLFECTSEFVDTSYEHNGAGITAFGMSLDITRSRFADNAGPVGSFLHMWGSSHITDSVFARNGSGLAFSCQIECDLVNVAIDRNRFVRNGGDGLRISDTGTFDVSDNVAERNTGWGLYADPTVTVTGTGNTASGNGQPAQCSGVPCN